MPSELSLSELKSVAEKATLGPWKSEMLGGGKGLPNKYSIRVDCPDSGEGRYLVATVGRFSGKAATNAAHIAAFHPQAALALIARCEAAERSRDAYEGSLEIRSRDLGRMRIELAAVKAEVELRRKQVLDDIYEISNLKTLVEQLKEEKRQLKNEVSDLRGFADLATESARKILGIRES